MVSFPMNFAVFCLSLIAHATGLVAPGWLAARLLGWRAGWAWAAAVPLSMLFLLCGVELFDAIGVPLRLGPMVLWVLAVNGGLAFALWKWPPREVVPAALENSAAAPSPGERWQTWLLVGGAALLVVLAVWRGLLAPLSGFDTTFRWDFLARVMLRVHSLAFYPPRTAAEFQLYFHPDGFAPLVSVSYWWVHLVCALAGAPATDAVMPMVIAQYAGGLALAGGLAAHLAGARRAGWLAVALLAGTPLFFRAALIGQETGLTAVGFAGMLFALLRAKDTSDTRALMLAGLFAGAAGLAREYGPALVAVGGLALLWRRAGWRALAVFGGVAALLLAPWHLRNLLRDGNPLYGHSLGGLFPVNATAAALMNKYHELFGFSAFDGAAWRGLFTQIFSEAGLVLLAGGPAALWLVRRAGWLAAGAVLGVSLFIASVPYTSGGPGYALRVLSPALVLLAIAAAMALEGLGRGPVRSWVVTGVVLLSVGWTVWCVAVFPLPRDLVPTDKTWVALNAESPPPGEAERVLADKSLASVFNRGARVLTENAYAHAVLANAGSGADLVPIWSPEVAFLFDRKLSPAEQRRRLREKNITLLLFYPGSPNTKFLIEASPFYTEPERARWRLLGQIGGIFAILEIPAE